MQTFDIKEQAPEFPWGVSVYNIIETRDGVFQQSWGPYDTYLDAVLARAHLEDLFKSYAEGVV